MKDRHCRVVERLRTLLDEHDSIRKREAEFKNACRVEMAEMEAELQRLQQPRDQQVRFSKQIPMSKQSIS